MQVAILNRVTSYWKDIGLVICILAVALQIYGCSWRYNAGTRHTIVIALGMVSTSAKDCSAITDSLENGNLMD